MGFRVLFCLCLIFIVCVAAPVCFFPLDFRICCLNSSLAQIHILSTLSFRHCLRAWSFPALCLWQGLPPGCPTSLTRSHSSLPPPHVLLLGSQGHCPRSLSSHGRRAILGSYPPSSLLPPPPALWFCGFYNMFLSVPIPLHPSSTILAQIHLATTWTSAAASLALHIQGEAI